MTTDNRAQHNDSYRSSIPQGPDPLNETRHYSAGVAFNCLFSAFVMAAATIIGIIVLLIGGAV